MTRKMGLKIILGISVLLICALAFGEEAAHHGGGEEEAGVPKIVYYEFLNFGALVIILYFVLRGKISGFFSQRHQELTKALVEAQKIKEEAQRKHQEFTLKIQHLEAQKQTLFEQMKRDGEETRKQIIEEAKRLSQQIKDEAKRSAQTELERAKQALHDEVMDQALNAARSLLSQSVVEKDQRRLQKEFVEKIEAVQ